MYTGDPKSYWKLVNRLVKKSGSSAHIPPLFNSDEDTVVTEDTEKAELLNRYFCSISSVDDSGKCIPEFAARTDSVFNSLIVSSDELL